MITVHCWFASCPHVEQDTDPVAAHDAMERHYQTEHAAQIRFLIDASEFLAGEL